MAMKIYMLFSALLAIIVIACLFGLQASATESTYQYSQFYTMTSGSVPSNAISASQQIEIAGNTPSHVYLGEQMQSVSYTQYQSTPSYTGGNFLWIKGATAWTQYAVVPQGATVSLLAISSTGGSGSFTSDGQIYSNSYVLYPNSQLTFYAGTIGRHTLSFTLNGWASNQVVINVVAATSYTQPSYYPGYYSGYYPWDNYQRYYEPSNPPRDRPNDGNPGKKPSENPHDNPGGKPGGNPGGNPSGDSGGKPGGNPGGNPSGDSGGKPSGNPRGNPSGDSGGKPGGNPSEEHRIEIKGGETQTSGNPGVDTNTGEDPSNAPSTIPANPSTNVPSTNPSGETNTGENPSNAPSITPANPSTNVLSTNPSGEHRIEIRGGETHTSEDSGRDNNKCDTGYHLENGKCVLDQ
jgi:hypothetical protein